MAEARRLKSREYNTDIFNARQGAGQQKAYEGIKSNPFAAPVVRATYQDSNIFNYKDQSNPTWQPTDWVSRKKPLLKQSCTQAKHSADMPLDNSHSSMKHIQTTSQATHTMPTKELYNVNNPTDALVRKGTEFYGTPNYNKEARKDLMSADANWNNHTVRTSNVDNNNNPSAHKKQRVHQIGSTASWTNPDYNQIKGNPQDKDSQNTFHKRAEQLASNPDVFPTSAPVNYQALQKKQQIDEDVLARTQDWTYSDLFGQAGKIPRSKKQSTTIAATSGWNSSENATKGWREGAGANERKRDFLSSETFDKPRNAAPAKKDIDHGHRVPGVDSKTAKVMELQTSALNSNGFYEKAYQAPVGPNAREVVDLNLRNLPPDATDESVKSCAKVSHVI